MLFSDIAGQPLIKTKLKASVGTGRIPHAQLFIGPEGCGTLPMAIAYAQYVCCLGDKQGDSCGQCASCRKFAKLAHPDLHFSFPVNTTKKIAKDPVSDDFIADWRELVLGSPYFQASSWYTHIGLENKQGLINRKEGEAIVRKLSLKPFESDYKVMIVWLPEKMHPSVGNMLLKLIEEPPDNTLFLMVSENPEQLLLTISSRTQPIKLARISDAELREFISNRYNLSVDQLDNVVRLANGNLIKAQEVINQSADTALFLEKFAGIMRMCWKRDYFGVNDWVDDMAALGREQIKSFFGYALRMVRENFITNLKKPEIVYQTKEETDFSSKFHSYINGKNVLQLYDEMNRACSDIERNGYPKIVLFDLALHIMKLIR